ncbi:MAG: hypothetical protein MUP62_00150, partial [Dehalococcoidia bacterium]|nr:hypothetical protein [Dehalococcoidia bacterium]
WFSCLLLLAIFILASCDIENQFRETWLAPENESTSNVTLRRETLDCRKEHLAWPRADHTAEEIIGKWTDTKGRS